MKSEEVAHIYKMTLNPKFKGGICTSLDEVLYLNTLHHKNFTYRVLPEYMYDFQIVLYLQKNSPYLRAFNRKIFWLKDGGIINYIVSQYLNPMYLNEQQLSRGPKKLTIQKLSGGFQVWLIGCGISLIAFVGEKFHGLFFVKKKVEKISVKTVKMPSPLPPEKIFESKIQVKVNTKKFNTKFRPHNKIPQPTKIN